MSNYGSYPGPPQEPWGRQPPEPYGQPADPWGGGGSDPWGGNPSSPPPAGYPGYDRGGYDQPGYQRGGYDQGYDQGPAYGTTRQYEQPGYPTAPAAEPVWGQPVPPPPRKGGNRVLVLVVVALALLVVAGGVAAVVKLGGSDEDPAAAPTSQAAADPSGEPDPSQDASPAPESSTDARFVKAGQCVVNEGSNEQPKLKIVECGAKTFEVLARFDGTIDYEAKCKGVEGYQFHYFFDSELNPLDFVLCLKQR